MFSSQALLFLLLPCLTLAQDLYCEVPGACVDNVDVASSITPSYNECNLFCQSIPECAFYTFYPSLSACVAFSQCNSTSTAACPDCLSGERGCPLQPDPQCDIPGWCDGNLLALSIETGSAACLRKCKVTADCTWYNYNTADRLCALNGDCVLYDPDRPDSVTGEVTCGPDYDDFSLLFVIGGETQNGQSTSDVEVIDLESPASTPCLFKPANFPVAIAGAVATFLHEGPHVCAGTTGGGQVANTCGAYDGTTDVWTQHSNLLLARQRAAGVMLNDEYWWITGGLGAGGFNDYLDETEIFIDGAPVGRSVDLPVARERHSLLKIDETRFFLSGGRGQQQDGRRTWIYDREANAFEEQAEASQDRDGEFAGLITRSDGSKEVVVAGGVGFSSSEIFSLTDMAWRDGPDLPVELYEGASVPYGSSFLLVGGRDGTNDVESQMIFRYDEVDDAFVQLEHSLAVGRRYLSAVLVPDGYVECAAAPL